MDHEDYYCPLIKDNNSFEHCLSVIKDDHWCLNLLDVMLQFLKDESKYQMIAAEKETFESIIKEWESEVCGSLYNVEHAQLAAENYRTVLKLVLRIAQLTK